MSRPYRIIVAQARVELYRARVEAYAFRVKRMIDDAQAHAEQLRLQSEIRILRAMETAMRLPEPPR